MKKRFSVWLMLILCVVVTATAQTGANSAKRERALQEDAEWIPTGVWPFLNRRFQTAEVVTGFIKKKKTVVPCNIHIGRQTLYYVDRDTLMEALPGNVSRVVFPNGETYIPVDANTFGMVVHEDSAGRVVRVRRIDKKQFDGSANDISRLGSFNLGGDFGELNMDLISVYDAKPEEKPLPILDTYYFIHNLEIFEVTDKNILSRIPVERRKEYKAFTRSAEILTHNQSSVMKIWQKFFAGAVK